eukprot:Skav219225  [mRNA]  locus=scaffold2965:7481:10271:+ [translate_table: standard]
MRVDVSVTPATLEEAKELIAKLKSICDLSADNVIQHEDFDTEIKPVANAVVLSNIVTKLNLPNKKPDAITRLLLAWRSAVQAFEDVEDDVALIKAYLAYAKPLLLIARSELKNGALTKEEALVCEAVSGYMHMLGEIASAKSMGHILQDPAKDWAFDAMVLPEYMSITSALKATGNIQDVLTEIQKTGSDFKVLVSKLGMFETCCDVCHGSRKDDPLLAPLRDKCSGFMKAFEGLVRDMLKTIQHSILSTLVTYIEKYSPVCKAAEGWEMESYQWAFDPDDHSQANSDFKCLHGALKGFRAEMPNLQTLAGHSSGNSMVKRLVDEASTLLQSGKKLCADSGVCGAVVMVSAFFIVSNPDGGKNVDLSSVQSHCRSMYGFEFAKLPGKLKSMVDDYFKKQSSDELDKTSKKKEKKKPKEKSDKGSDKGSAKDAKHKADEGKEKKSKKRKDKK